jgi:DNA replication protein DnaC
MRARFDEVAAHAGREQLSYLGFLAELVMAECDDCTTRRTQRRLRAADFPPSKRLDEFDFAARAALNPGPDRSARLGDWVRQGRPLS